MALQIFLVMTLCVSIFETAYYVKHKLCNLNYMLQMSAKLGLPLVVSFNITCPDSCFCTGYQRGEHFNVT